MSPIREIFISKATADYRKSGNGFLEIYGEGLSRKPLWKAELEA